jgi:hypothetical protein
MSRQIVIEGFTYVLLARFANKPAKNGVSLKPSSDQKRTEEVSQVEEERPQVANREK